MISQYEKRGDGMNSFVVYKVVTKVKMRTLEPSLDFLVVEVFSFQVPGSVPGFSKKEYVVWRRFSDFLGLHEKLATKHLQNGRIVPPAPEKSVLGKCIIFVVLLLRHVYALLLQE